MRQQVSLSRAFLVLALMICSCRNQTNFAAGSSGQDGEEKQVVSDQPTSAEDEKAEKPTEPTGTTGSTPAEDPEELGSAGGERSGAEAVGIEPLAQVNVALCANVVTQAKDILLANGAGVSGDDLDIRCIQQQEADHCQLWVGDGRSGDSGFGLKLPCLCKGFEVDGIQLPDTIAPPGIGPLIAGGECT